MGYRSRVWPRKVKQTNGHGAIAQMSPVIQRVRRRHTASPNFFQSGFSAPLPPPETLQSSSSSSSFRNLKFHPRGYTPSRSSVNTHPEVGPPRWRRSLCDRRSAAFRKLIFRPVNFRSSAGSTATSPQNASRGLFQENVAVPLADRCR